MLDHLYQVLYYSLDNYYLKSLIFHQFFHGFFQNHMIFNLLAFFIHSLKTPLTYSGVLFNFQAIMA